MTNDEAINRINYLYPLAGDLTFKGQIDLAEAAKHLVDLISTLKLVTGMWPVIGVR